MGRLLVIEGLDGAGKRTLADALGTALTASGATVARCAFPRYAEDVHAGLVRDALYGRLPHVADSVHGLALLFALDRHAASAQLRQAAAANDVVLVDRYVASNAAYGAARLHEGADGPFVAWLRALEVDRLGVPVPDAQLLLDTPPGLATARAHGRAAHDADRPRDSFESDDGLQTRCAAVYAGLAAAGWLAPWTVLDGSTGLDAVALARTLVG